MPDQFTYDVFLSHSAKDKAVVRLSDSLSASNGERARVRCRSSDSAERLRQDGLTSNAKGRRLHDKVELQPCPCAFGSDWAQLPTHPQPSTFNSQPDCDSSNQERRFLPLRLDSASAGASLPPLRSRCAQSLGFGLCRVPRRWQSLRNDLRTVARRMAGVARPDSARALSPKRSAVRSIPGDGRQP